MNEKNYVITKELCQKWIDARCHVCDYCGRNPVPLETVDNAGNLTFWAGCMHGGEAGNFTQGVSRQIFDLAVKLVLDGETLSSLSEYEWRKTIEDRTYWFQQQTSAACRLLRKIEDLKTREPRFTREEFFADSRWN